MLILQQEAKNVPIESIQPHPQNPRSGDLEAIKKSIEFNGFYGYVLVQKATGYICVGNHRYKAMKELGAKEIPAIFVDLDDAMALKVMLSDNRTSDLGTYDFETLASLLEEIDTSSSLEGTGYSEEDLSSMLNAVSQYSLREPEDFNASPTGSASSSQKREQEPPTGGQGSASKKGEEKDHRQAESLRPATEKMSHPQPLKVDHPLGVESSPSLSGGSPSVPAQATNEVSRSQEGSESGEATGGSPTETKQIERKKTDSFNTSFYSQKVTPPVYSPKGKKPLLSELTNLAKMQSLLDEIEGSSLSEEEKKFLRLAAHRHTVFFYQEIAEYYCHASLEMQRLMEKSALVLIDINKSIEYGFVEVSSRLARLFQENKEIIDSLSEESRKKVFGENRASIGNSLTIEEEEE